VVCWGVNRWITTAKDTLDVASLERDPRPGYEWYVTEVVWHRPTHSLRAKFKVDIHQTLYLPLMVFVALMAASRATFGNRHFRVRLEILGLALLVLRTLLRFVLLERWTDGLAHDGPFDMFLQLIQLAVAAPRGMAVAFPLILWFLLSRKALLAATATQKA
jgi:lipopolysaccharide export LptBFGC system permease protein LptF